MKTKVNVEDLSESRKRVSVEISAEDVAAALKAAYKEAQQDAEVEGFRKGKVPEAVVKQKFGKKIEESVASNLIENTYMEALVEKGLKPISYPALEPGKIKENQAFYYAATLDVKPNFELIGYMDLDIPKNPTEPTEEELNSQIDMLRERHGEYEVSEKKCDTKDMVTVDFHCTVDGVKLDKWDAKNYAFVIEKGAVFPEFEESIAGKGAGESFEFKKTFPPGYHEKSVSGKNVIFHVTVKAVKAKKLPELNDAFALNFGIETVSGFKDRLREEIKKHKEKAEKERRKKAYMEKILPRYSFEVPESFRNKYFSRIVNSMMENVRMGVINPLDRDITADETKLKYEAMADIEARGDLILDAIGEKENITITDEDVSGAIEEIAGLRNETAEAVREHLSKEGTLSVLKDGLKREKVFDLVLDKKR
ncbi:MAG: trigger factor [Thermodesulfobacteriota bacterium]